jgi:DNA polymerase-1
VQTLYLVDASMYVFRAWHSMPDEFHDVDGHPVNAVHGYARFLLELIERQMPQHIAVAFDESLESSFRNTLYPAYKANREPAPASLRHQFALCQAFTAALGLDVLCDGAYEADDLIGTLLMRQRAGGFRGVIVSADKDLSQLLQAGDEQWDYARQQRWGADGVKARYGVHAHQIADYLGLTGDAIDNIPGVPGIGAKTASRAAGAFRRSRPAPANASPKCPYLRLRGAAAARPRG